MYQINKTKDGWLVALFNNQGIDKTQNGIARVDRAKFVDVEVHTTLNVKEVREYVYDKVLSLQKSTGNTSVSVRIEPGDVQVIYFVTE